MKKNLTLLFILYIAFSASASFRQRSKRSQSTEFDISEAPASPVSLKRFYFSQRLSHFDANDERRWLQTYWVVPTYYKKGGPAFLFINGQLPLDSGFGFPNTSLSYAEHLNAICFAIEHRFYGRTMPVNGSIINHLSQAQALEDVANFIKGIPKEFHLPKDIKWIVFGCSYSGRLAALARRQFPHLIHGAVCSSTPLLGKVDYYEYEQIVEESLNSYNSKCAESIMTAFEGIANIINSVQNMKKIAQLFNLSFSLPNDISITKTRILHLMLKIISRAVQNTDVSSISIAVVCRTMIEYKGTKLEALAEVRKLYMEHKMEGDAEEKIQGENYVEDQDKIINWDAWSYQRCSEFGYFSSRTNTTFLSRVKHLFLSIEAEIKMVCKPFYGPNFSIKNLTEKVDQMNFQYGGLDYNTSNTIFIHGSLDPWYKAGLYQKTNSSLYQTIFIKGVSHCADTYPPTDKDIPELKNARNEVLKILKSWLKNTTISSSKK